jgi:phage protein D
MPTSEFRLYLNNNPATEEQLDLFSEIRVDQAIGMASEAELHLALTVDDEGRWSGMEDEFAQPGGRVRVEIKVGDGEFVPLIDGPIVASRFELSAEPEESKMTLVVQDDGVLLNQEQKVLVYENQRADEIASQIFSDFGLTPEVDGLPDAGAALDRFVVQRGTAMQLLKELARRHGMFIYVKPGESPGTSIGVFKRPSWEPGDLPELLLLGEERNVARFSAEFDALKPLAAAAYHVSIADKSELVSETESADVEPLGDEAAHDVVTPARSLLARTREEQSDLDEATAAAVNLSSFAYTASAEVDADTYSGVLQPYQVLTVAGVGGTLSGDYLISRVTHVIEDEGYRQQFELRRNARSAGSNGNGGPVGGIL